MKIVAIVSQKGGVGKSTLAVHLAAAAEASGLTSVVLDLDQQASAAGWKDSREAETPVVTAIPHTRLRQGLETAKSGGADFVVIDTAPHAEAASLAAARAADLVLIPSRPGIFDLRAIGSTVEMLKLAEKPAYVVLNTMPPRASQLLSDAKEAVAVHGIPLAPVVLHQRAPFSHALTMGGVAAEYEPGGKASEEIAALLKWVRKMLAK